MPQTEDIQILPQDVNVAIALAGLRLRMKNLGHTKKKGVAQHTRLDVGLMKEMK